jgi:hypothetical protein
MTTKREELCDLFDLPYSTDEETLFECCIKYVKDGDSEADEKDIAIDDLRDKLIELKTDRDSLKHDNKELQKLYNELLANYKLMAVSLSQVMQGDPDIIDEDVWKLPIWDELKKEFGEE